MTPIVDLAREAAALARPLDCQQDGHDWKHIGGRNAGCERGQDCVCSVPVHQCAICLDYDYGENKEADAIRADCKAHGTDRGEE